ncbi:MAG: hypothetical protein LBB22_06275, partial [Treponema sp.]|nr:hypothetical protein [Treponema sp.]
SHALPFVLFFISFITVPVHTPSSRAVACILISVNRPLDYGFLYFRFTAVIGALCVKRFMGTCRIITGVSLFTV